MEGLYLKSLNISCMVSYFYETEFEGNFLCFYEKDEKKLLSQRRENHCIVWFALNNIDILPSDLYIMTLHVPRGKPRPPSATR